MIRTARMAFGLLAFALPTMASAHVKWFTDADVRQPPVTQSALLSPIFAAVLGAAVVLVFAGFLLDGWIAARWPHLLKRGRTTEAFEQRVIRAATGAYLIFLASWGGIILTPDLRSPASWLPVVQFAAAVSPPRTGRAARRSRCELRDNLDENRVGCVGVGRSP